MRLIILYLSFFVFGFFSCNLDRRNLKIFLPENFSGYGAIIFDNKNNCTKDNRTIVVQTDSLGIGYASTGDCFPNSGIRNHYFYYLKKGNSYVRINSLLSGTCHEADTLQGREALYENGGEFTGHNDYEILVFHIGKCNDPVELFYMDSPERKRLDSICRKYITLLNRKQSRMLSFRNKLIGVN